MVHAVPVMQDVRFLSHFSLRSHPGFGWSWRVCGKGQHSITGCRTGVIRRPCPLWPLQLQQLPAGDARIALASPLYHRDKQTGGLGPSGAGSRIPRVPNHRRVRWKCPGHPYTPLGHWPGGPQKECKLRRSWQDCGVLVRLL